MSTITVFLNPLDFPQAVSTNLQLLLLTLATRTFQKTRTTFLKFPLRRFLPLLRLSSLLLFHGQRFRLVLRDALLLLLGQTGSGRWCRLYGCDTHLPIFSHLSSSMSSILRSLLHQLLLFRQCRRASFRDALFVLLRQLCVGRLCYELQICSLGGLQ